MTGFHVIATDLGRTYSATVATPLHGVRQR